MQGFFRSFFTVSSYTAFSRVLGFFRDVLIAKYLGSTVTADAFFVAFRLPNFFRRVLAEGAYSAALIPVFSGIVIDTKDDIEAADFVENTMSLLLCITIPLTIIFYFGMPYIIQILAPGFSDNKEAFDLAVHFGKIIFPYLIFISLVAHFTSIMNVHDQFAAGRLRILAGVPSLSSDVQVMAQDQHWNHPKKRVRGHRSQAHRAMRRADHHTNRSVGACSSLLRQRHPTVF